MGWGGRKGWGVEEGGWVTFCERTVTGRWCSCVYSQPLIIFHLHTARIILRVSPPHPPPPTCGGEGGGKGGKSTEAKQAELHIIAFIRLPDDFSVFHDSV